MTQARTFSNSMDVFSLRDSVISQYKSFAKSFTKIKSDDIKEKIEAIYAQDKFWPEPLIQINPNYEPGRSISELVKQNVLHPACEEIFSSIAPHKHQEEAFKFASQGDSYVVTTGTGSGKSLCFFVPIVSEILKIKAKDKSAKTRAIIIYPMNALANSQLEEIGRFIKSSSYADKIKVARFTGQESDEERQEISKSPPDILLTNFMMLELLMTRQGDLDRTVINNCNGLQFLVLDELHTYRGRQGADVALLVRRVREHLAPNGLQCIGTSATMVSEGTKEAKNQVVAQTASKLFATTISEHNVITETLLRATDAKFNADTVVPLLSSALDRPIPENASNAELAKHPLAIWVETNLGMVAPEGVWVRAKPLTLSEAEQRLSEESKKSKDVVGAQLRHLLLISNRPEEVRCGKGSSKSFFAFKLHQFISGAGNSFCTLEPIGQRRVSIDPQQFLPGTENIRLYSVHFCRECGQEYHPVRKTLLNGSPTFLARDIDDFVAERAEEDNEDLEDQFGFLLPVPKDSEFEFTGQETDYPEHWLEQDRQGNLRLKGTYRRQVPIRVNVSPSGAFGSGEPFWFIRGKFKFCLRCKEAPLGNAKDRNRLASLSSEGRSSATTVLVSSILNWMHSDNSDLESNKRKLLGFTDNRQDAALQAGHFNDFLYVSLTRAAFLGALEIAGTNGVSGDELGLAQQKALGFEKTNQSNREEWLLEPNLRGFNLDDAEKTLREVLAYRIWFDQRRGWRYTNPNLEELGLLNVEYQGISELAADQELFESAPDLLRNSSADVRSQIYKELFDHLRQGLAIKSNLLEAAYLEQVFSRSHNRLKTPWGFSLEEKPRRSRWLMLAPPARRENSLKDEDAILRGGIRSSIGRSLKSSNIWGRAAGDLHLTTAEYDLLIGALISAAVTHGLLVEEATSFDGIAGWKLNGSCIKFILGDGKAKSLAKENRFFTDFYRNLSLTLRSPQHALFSLEAREHTAQVDQEKRKVRELRFRFGKDEAARLKEANVREIGETDRFLPVMFCSPTMELGVDISVLNAVYLRNIPPTPANYAQRSGRAGRSGQAALVLTYCAALSPHDQYFFQDPRSMVHGAVKAPLLDLVNRDLVESHLHAIWLACTETPLDPSISEILALEEPGRPIKKQFKDLMNRETVGTKAEDRMKRMLSYLKDELDREKAPWFTGIAEFSDATARASALKFEQAFRRWRDLFSAAELQRDEARKTMDNNSLHQRERDAARRRHNQAIEQLDLLRQGKNSLSSDFYTYRYLATEGFLPGYNFPRLPLMAYIPSTSEGGGRQTFLQRPRFLALSEFGPRSLVYHEGKSFQVVRILISVNQRDGATAEVQLPTKLVKICKACGAGHFNDQESNCHSCSRPLNDSEIVRQIYRVENVATRQIERITANDEERRRQGFELQTVYQWSLRDGKLDVKHCVASFEEDLIANLRYGPTATITRINKGLKRRRNQTQHGFLVDPLTGYWEKNEDEDDDDPILDPSARVKQWIVPSVEDRKNALLIQPNLGADVTVTTIATLQYAILRGIEEEFQLEEGEILAEPMPTRDGRNGFLLYEAAEGGAGVLTRLVSDGKSLSQVALEGLKIMHFKGLENHVPETVDELKQKEENSCVAGCYKCLLSYFNQTDHEFIDRRDETALETLLKLAKAAVKPDRIDSDPPHSASGAIGVSDAWMERFSKAQIRSFDGKPYNVNGIALPLVWRKFYVVAVQEPAEKAILSTLEQQAFEVVVFDADGKNWDEKFQELAKLLKDER